MALPTLQSLDGRITDAAQEQPRAWFAGPTHKIDCRAAVLAANDGDFLIRENDATTPPSLSLLVKASGPRIATFPIVYDSKQRFVFDMAATYGSLEDLIFAIGSKTLHGPNAEEVILGNAVVVNQTGYGTEPGWDEVSMGVPEPPARFFRAGALSGSDSSQSSHVPPALPARNNTAAAPTARAAAARASSAAEASTAATPKIPSPSSAAAGAEAEAALVAPVTSLLEINRANQSQSYGFSLGESSEGAKFITGIVSGGLSDGKLRLGDSIVSINGKVAVDLAHSEVIAAIVSGCQLVLRIARPSGSGSAGGDGDESASTSANAASSSGGGDFAAAGLEPDPEPDPDPEPEPVPELTSTPTPAAFAPPSPAPIDPAEPMPEELEWKLVETTLPVAKSRVYSILFGEDSASHWTAAYNKKKYTEVTLGEWDAAGSKRNYQYTIPRKGMQGATAIIEDQEVLAGGNAAAAASAVLVTTKAPGAPFGSSFQSTVQYQLVADTEATCSFKLTGSITWVKSCSLKGTITKKVKQAIEKATRELPGMITAHLGV